MRILLVSAASSIHTVRWVNGLAERGHEVHLASVHPVGIHAIDPQVHVHLGPQTRTRYITDAWWLRRLARRVRPHIVNVHYATGYGLLARLARLDVPVLLSVWGSDVYDTPRRNRLAAHVVRANLAAATRLASTSRCMAEVTQELAPGRDILITPFGVDTDVFTPGGHEPATDSVVRVGTVKAMAAKYGIDVLIDAFATMCRNATTVTELHLYGEGPDRAMLENRARNSGVGERIVVHGAVSHDQVPEVLRGLDVFAALSVDDSESFGVAIVEAGACGLPSVVSDADGPAEVVEEGRTGFIVAKRDVAGAAAALGRLVDDPELRATMGREARAHVEREYSWTRSLELMEEAYESTITSWRPGRRTLRPQ